MKHWIKIYRKVPLELNEAAGDALLVDRKLIVFLSFVMAYKRGIKTKPSANGSFWTPFIHSRNARVFYLLIGA